ncbi:hypothetical protein PVAND_012611 [Polypedilum vanderplanki]|uniref:N-acyl-aliphatic-L-amino acid amidohydrolase n=1 Tax=Polypedilum vanderplanki TaxID=319348 RepID=A0A9J6CMY3_POLVA|nr:hypothetical protein PVAND_012611 [Polypedilum vanderplanki]
MTEKSKTDACVEFLKKLAEELKVEFKVSCPAKDDRPTVILSVIGTQPELPAIMLNSHMDVVPVFEEFWTHKPFDADIDEEGKIFARGAQDMKCVGMQYLAAIRRLKRHNVTLKRTIHVTFVPDEEIFGPDGMKAFVNHNDFRQLNVGFLLDEGIASPTNVFSVFYGERTCWQILFRIHGQPGHGSLLLEDTAAESMHFLLNKIYDFRRSQEKMLEDNPILELGDVTTINVTRINGGKQRNVLPAFIELTVDIRMALTVNLDDFEAMINRWAKECGKKIEIEFVTKEPFCPPTKIDDSNAYWTAFKSAVDELNLEIKPLVFPAGTDAAYVRAVGIPAIGFSPMNNTPVLLHDHDEFLHADVYLKGIEIYEKILEKVCNF